MKIRSTLFGALLLCAALAVPAAADQDKNKDKDKKQKEEQSQSEERAAERGKPTEAEQKTDNDRDTPGEPLTDKHKALNHWQDWWNFNQGRFDASDFDGMDKDENQSISREEWAGSFAMFDRDNNGVISQQEYEDSEYRNMTREALFGKMDVNGNGRLEPPEWWWSRDAFALVDRDGNGWVTPDELLHRGEPQPR